MGIGAAPDAGASVHDSPPQQESQHGDSSRAAANVLEPQQLSNNSNHDDMVDLDAVLADEGVIKDSVWFQRELDSHSVRQTNEHIDLTEMSDAELGRELHWAGALIRARLEQLATTTGPYVG